MNGEGWRVWVQFSWLGVCFSRKKEKKKREREKKKKKKKEKKEKDVSAFIVFFIFVLILCKMFWFCLFVHSANKSIESLLLLLLF